MKRYLRIKIENISGGSIEYFFEGMFRNKKRERWNYRVEGGFLF